MPRLASITVTAAVTLIATLAGAGAASADPAGEIYLYGTAGNSDTGLVATAGTSPAIAGVNGAAPNYELAYNNTTSQIAVSGSVQTGTLGVAMAPGASPRIIGLGTTGFETAFPFTNGDMTTAGTAGTTINHYGMDSGTSADIGSVPGSASFLDAFNSSAYQPWTEGTGAGGQLKEPVYAGTNPAVASVSSSYELVFEGSNAHLWQDSTAGAKDAGLGMEAGTSPDISPEPSNTYEIAFQANSHYLYVDNGTTATDTKEAMDPAASPSITNLAGGGYEIAYRGADGNLCLYGSAGAVDTGLSVEPGTNPGIGGLPAGGYEVAYATPETPTAPAPPQPILPPAPGPPTSTNPTSPVGVAPDTSGNPSTITDPDAPLRRGLKRMNVYVGMWWHWKGRRSELQRFHVDRLPRHGRVTFSCSRKSCAQPSTVTASRAHIARMRRELERMTYHAGDRIHVTIQSPGYGTIDATIRIRRGHKPVTVVLTRPVQMTAPHHHKKHKR